jgi:hypothetical protein
MDSELVKNSCKLSEEIERMEEKLVEMRFRLQKAHCELLILMDPSIQLQLNEALKENDNSNNKSY